MGNLRATLSFVGFGLVASSGCIFDHDEPREDPFEECKVHEDCAFLDDGDACFAPARCLQNRCDREFLQNATDCQCDFEGHCEAFGLIEQGCNIINCFEHQCSEVIMPAGPATEQTPGDCKSIQCDGMTAVGVEEEDLEDLDDDNNSCTEDSCTADGPLNAHLADGDVCLDASGICYAGNCSVGCVPANPEACGAEGPDEPLNNLAGSGTQYPESTEVCGMLDADDIDWYTMYAEDEDFVTDILGFELRGTTTLELCAYVLCDNHADLDGGFPDGGCSNKLPGPQGSHGCCWQGPAETLTPTWDLDCTDTSEDSGTVFFSVRAPAGDTCENYTVFAHY